MATAFRYLDLVLLVVACRCSSPLTCRSRWMLVAGVWVIQYAIEITADRRSARALSEGTERRHGLDRRHHPGEGVDHRARCV
jgi:hypothetical protein